jgi:hypothetical protein
VRVHAVLCTCTCMLICACVRVHGVLVDVHMLSWMYVGVCGCGGVVAQVGK